MANISFYLPCEPFWHEGIYQLETSDPATGYNPVLSTDGPANRQWNELGDRTLWLRAFLDAGHKDGLHHIRAENILPGSRIPERKLRLNYATHDLAALLAQIESGVEKARDILALRNSQELSPAAILGRILPSLREYYDSGASFDLLNATASLREFAATGISKEISGDDSLDVVSTAGIYPGNTYFLMDDDGSRLETATVLSVLTDTRIRFTRALEISRTAGILSSANIPPPRPRMEQTFYTISCGNRTGLTICQVTSLENSTFIAMRAILRERHSGRKAEATSGMKPNFWHATVFMMEPVMMFFLFRELPCVSA